MAYLHGRLFKRIHFSDNDCVEFVARDNGFFQFYHRFPCGERGSQKFESAVYISAETAEAAARLKFNL